MSGRRLTLRGGAALLAGVALVGGVGCAPSLTELLDDKHYREAVCAGFDEGDAELITEALARDADAQVHVHSVTRRELGPVLGGQMSHVDGRAEFVRVRFVTNALPVDDYHVTLGVAEVNGMYEASAASLTALVATTREALPPNRTYSTYATPDNVLKGGAAVFTLGFSLLFTGGFTAETVMAGPSMEDYARTAPIATRLYGELGGSGCSNPGGSAQVAADCTLFFVLPRRPNARWRLVVEQTFTAKRVGSTIADDCKLTHESQMDLRAEFEGATRPLVELAE